MKKRFTEAQIVGFPREADAGIAVKGLCRKHGFSDASYYLWRSKFGGMSVSDAKRVKELERHAERRVTLRLIAPGKPMQSAYVESFNGRLRDECVNEHWFTHGAIRQIDNVLSLWQYPVHMPALTPRGARFRALVAEVFRTKVLILQGAERLARSVGLTSARWQILAVVADGPATVADVARMVGLTRQSVQQIADAMEAEGLVAYVENPRHKRAKLVQPTAKAREALARLRPREIDFANAMGRRHSREALEIALTLLRRTRQELEIGLRKGEP